MAHYIKNGLIFQAELDGSEIIIRELTLGSVEARYDIRSAYHWTEELALTDFVNERYPKR